MQRPASAATGTSVAVLAPLRFLHPRIWRRRRGLGNLGYERRHRERMERRAPWRAIVLRGAVFPSPAAPLAPEQVVRRNLTIRGTQNYGSLHRIAAVEFVSHARARFPLDGLSPPGCRSPRRPRPFSAPRSPTTYAWASGPNNHRQRRTKQQRPAARWSRAAGRDESMPHGSCSGPSGYLLLVTSPLERVTRRANSRMFSESLKKWTEPSP